MGFCKSINEGTPGGPPESSPIHFKQGKGRSRRPRHLSRGAQRPRSVRGAPLTAASPPAAAAAARHRCYSPLRRAVPAAAGNDEGPRRCREARQGRERAEPRHAGAGVPGTVSVAPPSAAAVPARPSARPIARCRRLPGLGTGLGHSLRRGGTHRRCLPVPPHDLGRGGKALLAPVSRWKGFPRPAAAERSAWPASPPPSPARSGG